jgi:hypothetical protein
MPFLPKTFFIFLCSCCLCLATAFLAGCKSQKTKTPDPFKFSSATDFYHAEKFESKEKKRYKYLYAYNMRKVLYGNQCVNDVTHQFGYEYIPAFDSAEEPRNDLEIWFHNFFTSVGITFRHGLLWKRKVKKRIRYCAESSGDFNG